MGPKQRQSTVLTSDEEVLIVAFRKQTLLPLDDCLYALQETIPHLTRSSLHRCLQRHGISRLPDTRDKAPKKRFKKYPIGYFHIDNAEVRLTALQNSSLLNYTTVPLDLMLSDFYAT